MKISEIFGLNVSQLELDFIDVDVNKDCLSFINSFIISNQRLPQPQDVSLLQQS